MGSIVGVGSVYEPPQRARTGSVAFSPLPLKLPSLFLTLSPSSRVATNSREGESSSTIARYTVPILRSAGLGRGRCVVAVRAAAAGIDVRANIKNVPPPPRIFFSGSALFPLTAGFFPLCSDGVPAQGRSCGDSGKEEGEWLGKIPVGIRLLVPVPQSR